MLKSFYHTGFVVEDLEKSVAFYADVLGMRIATRIDRQGETINQILGFPNAHIKGAFLDKEEGHQLELIQYVNPPGGRARFERNDSGATHLAFFVEDLDRFYQDTSQRGLSYLNPPTSLRDEAGKVVRKIAYSQDPDGNWLEFIEAF
jgi:catechol 2,3-dioxygenase-like lactoylglutathione lyase family enzyme